MYGCNPITNDGCDEAAGQACDVNYGTYRFQCFDGPNEVALCESCGQADGFCAPGSTCFGGDCARFCCDDDDCSPDSACDHAPLEDFGMGEVGLCLRKPAMGTGGAGGGNGGAGGAGGAALGGAGGTSAGGAGGTDPHPTIDCQPPSPPPSGGACVPHP
ncbi:MAG TPA: hypothetical protein ENK57_14915 [Polyangiaceae bacterium]|nr:hypothetical protein [Polyangiaceae bacterium]